VFGYGDVMVFFLQNLYKKYVYLFLWDIIYILKRLYLKKTQHLQTKYTLKKICLKAVDFLIH
jgi:hypothetical protein